MVTIRIANASRDLNDVRDIDESWINQQINGRRTDNLPVCVQITIKEESVNMSLASSGCQGGGGSRQPNLQENRIFELWDKAGMHKADFHGGNLVAFFKQLRNIL